MQCSWYDVCIYIHTYIHTLCECKGIAHLDLEFPMHYEITLDIKVN